MSFRSHLIILLAVIAPPISMTTSLFLICTEFCASFELMQHLITFPNTNVPQKVTWIRTCSAKLQPHLTKTTIFQSPWLRTEDAYPPLFFRKLPGNRNVYAQMRNEKEQEMTSPVNHSEDTQHIIQGEEFIDDDLDSQTLGNAGGSPAFRSLIRTTTNHCY